MVLTEKRKPAALELPEKVLRDLIRNGGENLKRIDDELSNEIQRRYNDQREELKRQMATADMLAAALDQPEDSVSRKLAEAMLADYKQRLDDQRLDWGTI